MLSQLNIEKLRGPVQDVSNATATLKQAFDGNQMLLKVNQMKEKFQSKIQELEKNNKELTLASTTLKDRVTLLEKDNNALNSENTTLKNQVGAFEKTEEKNKELTEQVKTLSKANECANKTIDEFAGKLQTSEQNLKALTDQFKQLMSALELASNPEQL